MRTLQIGNLILRLPIIQGGMGVGVSLSGLAAAVANEGGIGVISATGLSLLYAKASDSFVEAGGIYTGEDMYRILEMGTSSIQMGARFVTTTECDAADAFKNQKHQ